MPYMTLYRLAYICVSFYQGQKNFFQALLLFLYVTHFKRQKFIFVF
jgi:hypothetical protein